VWGGGVCVVKVGVAGPQARRPRQVAGRGGAPQEGGAVKNALSWEAMQTAEMRRTKNRPAS